MSLINSVPKLRLSLRRHLATAGTALGVALLSMAAHGDGSAGYQQHCLVCHGPDLKGVNGLGTSLVDSPYVTSKSVDELVAFLKVGRMPSDPENISGGAMPGLAWMDEAELRAIAEYVKGR